MRGRKYSGSCVAAGSVLSKKQTCARSEQTRLDSNTTAASGYRLLQEADKDPQPADVGLFGSNKSVYVDVTGLSESICSFSGLMWTNCRKQLPLDFRSISFNLKRLVGFAASQLPNRNA